MSSEVTISNLALGHLGDRATVSSLNPPEGSAQAQHCAQFYPLARNSTLEDHDWSFARTRATLAPLLVDPPPGWLYGYELPSDCLSARSIIVPGQTTDDGDAAFEIEGPALYTNVETAVLKYTQLITDPNRYSPTFIDALAWRLASYLAGPVLKGETGSKAGVSCFNVYKGLISEARFKDANKSNVKLAHVPAHIAAR